MSDTPHDDPQTGQGAVFGDEFVDVENNEPGDQSPPPGVDDPQTGSSSDPR